MHRNNLNWKLIHAEFGKHIFHNGNDNRYLLKNYINIDVKRKIK